jgi:GNAT superfamily N-acetyltransferase
MAEAQEWSRGSAVISTERRRLQVDVVHGFLVRSYWAREIPREIVERSIESSLCFGVYETGEVERQVGFARVVTDFATFAWIADVFVLEEARGRGLAVWLMEVIAGHRDLQGLRRWILATRDAHGLYRKTGFAPLAHPEAFLERWRPDFYSRKAPQASSP